MFQGIIISSCTGTDVESIVCKMLSKLMTDEVLAKFSLKGMRGKESFNGLATIRALLDGKITYNKTNIMPNLGFNFSKCSMCIVQVKSHPKTSSIVGDDEVSAGIAEALKKAADRYYQRTK